MTITFYTGAAGKHRWHAVASNALIVADSGQGYAPRSNARRAWRRFEAQVRAGVEVAG